MALKPSRRALVVFPVMALLTVALILVLRSSILRLPPVAKPSPTDTPPPDYLSLGDGHAARTERAAAVAAYQEAARLRPDDPVPYLRMAQIYVDWGRTGDALDILNHAEALIEEGEEADALDARLEQLRVTAYVARADWPAVVEHSQRLLTLLPLLETDVLIGDSAVRHKLVRAYTELGEWDAARVEYEALLEADPGDILAHERLGILLLGDDPAAIGHFAAAGTELAIRLLVALQEPGAVDDPAYAYALLGQVLFEEGEWALAARLLERALASNPDYADVHAQLGYALGQMAYIQGEAGAGMDEAHSHLLRAVELTPDSVVAHIFLGLHYDRVGDIAAARSEYEAAYDLDPSNPVTCVEIGQTWAAEGRYVAAEVWLREAVSLGPEDPALWEVLARFYTDHNITGEDLGVEAATRLLELLPDEPRAHDLRGWAAFQVGDYETAEASLQQAVTLDPNLASAHYHLGLLWADQGLYQRAQETFTRALDLDTTGELVTPVERALRELP
jgi:tetratricopeptide (TPR) repeat protein